MVNLTATEQDDSAFVDLVNRVLHGTIACYKPRELYVIQIDTWFDHRELTLALSRSHTLPPSVLGSPTIRKRANIS